jgi:alginate O-acetyltransferase complex protein AlgI
MILSTVVNYFAARGIHAGRHKKGILILTILYNLGILGIFKYTGFIVENLNQIFRTHIPQPELTLPVGISFFTFQALSYVIDVYYGKVEAQKSFWKVLLYISFFPQLIAGPIVKYRDISEAIDHRTQDWEQVAHGLMRFIFGLSKKVLIANTMGQVADAIYAADRGSINIAAAWLGAIAYLFQIYYDFSGYSDMAIGLGEMFGFHFRENFLHPYSAVSVQDFWRKWHISLSTWFKEYLYIPLGGNRKGKARTCLNKMIVFFCTGLWHGASWTFVLWGLYHGVFLLLEEGIPALRKLPKAIGHLYTMLMVTVGFVLFRADTIAQALYMIRQMFTGFSFAAASVSLVWQQLTPWFLSMLFVAVIGAVPIRRKEGKHRQGGAFVLSVFLLVWSMIRLSGNTYNPFIYFRF